MRPSPRLTARVTYVKQILKRKIGQFGFVCYCRSKHKKRGKMKSKTDEGWGGQLVVLRTTDTYTYLLSGAALKTIGGSEKEWRSLKNGADFANLTFNWKFVITRVLGAENASEEICEEVRLRKWRSCQRTA